MKIFTTLFIIITLMTLPINAQENQTDSSAWRTGGVSTVNISQVSFMNWAAGGENSFSLNGLLSLYAKESLFL